MKVKLYAVNQDTGEQTFDRICEINDLFEDQNEAYVVNMEIKDSGRAWIGGGAAPLFLAMIWH